MMVLRSGRLYWSLVKQLQTGLLLMTGVAGYMSARCPVMPVSTLVGLVGSLFLAITGSTVLNMWYDRDLDARMNRTCRRPLPSGQIAAWKAIVFGLALSFSGVLWALTIDRLFGLIVFAGLFFDVVVYTIWLKRRTSWSIIWGGIAGGMPVLAGRALGVGAIDWVGLVLMLAILFWIPTHILTYGMRYSDDYQRAGIPTLASSHGIQFSRRIIAISSILAACAIAVAALGIGMTGSYLHLLGILSIILLALALLSLVRPSEKLNFGLFKYASVYMLNAMILLVVQAIH
jgi:protoheme IX farnesyltransferase